jgi:hypothetical protein
MTARNPVTTTVPDHDTMPTVMRQAGVQRGHHRVNEGLIDVASGH